MSELKHFFWTRKVEMSGASELYELLTPCSERVAMASSRELLTELEETLNFALTDAADADTDLVVDL